MKLGVIDEPIISKDADKLDIRKHSDALVRFIQNAATPITIGVQGEWGSGKTSLLNSIKLELEQRSEIKQIWINSWENSLLATPEESLIKIINEIIGELLSSDSDKERKTKILNAAGTVFKGALRVGATLTMGVKGGEVADELIEGSDQNGIKELRNSLVELVEEIRGRQSNPYERIIIYVDDLDRVEPKDAVKILELLKNIFSLPGCIFVLAIDYQVVVKGLEHKFGKQNADNEWEFRAFFDKIIQLPFMMPMGQYNIANYVNDLLSEVGFGGGASLSPEIITDVIKHSIGGNPRSLKRLVNSVALIEIFSSTIEANSSSAEALTIEKQSELLFALVCIQIAYPDIYNLLVDRPSLDSWDEDFAYEVTQGKEQEDEKFERDFDIAKKTDDFDEDWEQVVYRVCYSKPRYKAKVIDVSRVLSLIKEKIIDLPSIEAETALASVLNKTAVTNVTSTDKPQKSREVWKTEEEKTEANELWNLLLDNLAGKCAVYSKGRRSGSSGTIRVKHPNHPLVTFYMTHLGSLIGLRIDGGDIEANVALFDTIYEQKAEIENETGLEFVWKRSTTSKRQSINCSDKFTKDFAADWCTSDLAVPHREGWSVYLDWMTENAPKFEKAILKAIGS